MILFDANDNLLEVTSLTNVASGETIDDATVTVTLRNRDGTEVTGASWPVTLPAVAGVAGSYRVTLEDTLDLTTGQAVTAIIDADAGAGLKGHWERTLKVRKRT